MQYKALILDLDGTTVPSYAHALPSKRVQDAIARAQKNVSVALATSRNYFESKEIITLLNLKGPLVVSGGAQIIQGNNEKILWEKRLDQTGLKKLHTVSQSLGVGFYSNLEHLNKWVEAGEISSQNLPLSLFSDLLDQKRADQLVSELSSIPTIAAHKVTSWEDNEHFVVTVTHAQATKQHGIFEVGKILGIETHEIIGVGDSYNDFPLLMACGLKIAMGNAAEELKAIADFVAPTVTEDGVAVVIEKFILGA